MKFSRQNKKIGRDTLIFNMDSATNCPSKKLGLCDIHKSCYALKAEKMYKSVLPYRQLQHDLWINQSVIEISKEIKAFLTNKRLKTPIKYVRFNESGDFNSQSDVNKLIKLALLTPNVIFYGYTHRIDLNYDNLPDNLVINGSGFMIDNNFKVIDKSETNNYKLICPNNCRKCNLCKNKSNKVIAVIKH